MSELVNHILDANVNTAETSLILPDDVAISGSVTCLEDLTVNGTQIQAGLLEVNAGMSVSLNSNNLGFSPFPVSSITALVSSSTHGVTPTVLASQAGVFTMSGSFTALTIALPTAGSAIGGKYIFRNLDAVAHILSNSLETPGTKNISSGSAAQGTKITMGATVGASVILESDGISWSVVGGAFTHPTS